jgi:hypothetical protein
MPNSYIYLFFPLIVRDFSTNAEQSYSIRKIPADGSVYV